MAIELVRIDDRLVHGQVATTWTRNYEIEQILIIDDKTRNDPIAQSVANYAVPVGVKVMIFGVDQFAGVLKKTEIKKRTMLLFTNPIDILRLVNEGLQISEVNAGGMRFNETRRRLSKAISVTDAEDEAFKKLMDKGIHINVQMVPKDPRVDYGTLAK
ncbi:TPA: PTS sugar transporter subunit IIB [Enterococcus faecalis]|uniref:PTS system mannose/fructose/N-acetylgalactosamine-transporter subunit IIB n=1 Tax=Enterococcus faecalis TaxID=1351 RepID=UPI001C5C1D3F|nr:PTS sugar transporter subunit IIB [Enterococcus faecalis]HBI1719331.1 PTS sugar transporter subunit IIB [Enterococcus faecalis]HBI1722334.1 PTS sugar transporter subunit IIB [Enterococcus faecalis]HBI1725551.1 PTS sugar transporter subunit IIB [Enterococcus faecalis]HBI1728517.1 PTS sugar transporter subunit IIB [Enterococcus faecalis]